MSGKRIRRTVLASLLINMSIVALGQRGPSQPESEITIPSEAKRHRPGRTLMRGRCTDSSALTSEVEHEEVLKCLG